MLYLLYPSVIVFIIFIDNKQTTSIPRTFEKLATLLPTPIHDCAPPEVCERHGGLCTPLISGIFIIIKYIYNPFLIDALVAYGTYFK